MKPIFLFFSLFFFFCINTAYAGLEAKLVTAPIQKSMTPDSALHRLMIGNERFMHNQRHKIDYLKKAALTAQGQHPIAIILSCIDSRVPPEIIFDQNVGNIFVTRVAANVINHDVLAGMEYATAVTGAKLIVVLGHESCGAIKGACENVKLGHLTQLFDKLNSGIAQATKTFGKKECNNPAFINTAAEDNVRDVVNQIPKESPILRAELNEGKIKIVGAMYHLKTGRVVFLNANS